MGDGDMIPVANVSELEVAPDQSAEAAIESSGRQAELMRGLAISRTLPSDWVIHKGRDGKPDMAYLQDAGANRVAQAWGISFAPATVTAEQVDDHVVYHAEGTATDMRSQRQEFEVGQRSTADGFFSGRWERALRDGDSIAKISIRGDVRKAALTNLHGRLVRKLCGLGGIPAEVVKRYGVDPGTSVTYKQGDEAPKKKAARKPTKKATDAADQRALDDPDAKLTGAQWLQIKGLVCTSKLVEPPEPMDPIPWEEFVQEQTAHLTEARATKIIAGLMKLDAPLAWADFAKALRAR